jgi:hypothetical protein
VDQVISLTKEYLENVASKITAILRPTFPDSTSFDNLESKVSGLKSIGVSEIDFYLLDTMRNRDLKSLQRLI